jgi:ferredoxin-NADP reductase
VPVVTVPLAGVSAATPRSRLVTLDLRGSGFSFLPGQAVLVGAHGAPERRPYSIACSPEQAADTDRLELLMALEDNGELGPHLPSVAAGTLVDVDGPLGTFIFPAALTHRRLLFVAGGTGIAPLRAMIDHVLRRTPARAMSVLYSARRGDEFAFIDELRAHAASGRLELHPTVTRDDGPAWAGGRGRIGRTHFESVLHEPAATLCFVCGPRTMVSESVAMLQQLGVPESAIRTEGWAVPRV